MIKFKCEAWILSVVQVFRKKEWRKDKSETLNIPPYIIMHDKTVFDIASTMPQTNSELQDIYGMGPTKIRKYGSEVLKITKDFI